MLPDTSKRVWAHTSDRSNQRIEQHTQDKVRELAWDDQHIEQRLKELDREWDIERVLETQASSLILAGVLLSAAFGRKWLILPGVVSSFLLMHALQGWCPPVPLFRRRGVRTEREIDEERTALKALRGDFDQVNAIADDPAARATAALDAAQR